MPVRYPKEYPSRKEAELILDALSALNDIVTRYAPNVEAARVLDEARHQLGREWYRVFDSPKTSPWMVNRNRSGKLTRRDIRRREEWPNA